MKWIQDCQRYWTIKQSFHRRWLILVFTGLLAFVSALTVHFSSSAIQPSFAVIHDLNNIRDRSLEISGEEKCLTEIVKPGKAEKSNLELAQKAANKPVEVDTRLLKATIYLNSPETLLKLGYSHNPQDFSNFVRGHNAAIVASGTFAFGRDWQLMSEGKALAGNFRFTTGTVLGIKRGNQPEMVTLKKEGMPNWNDYWVAIAAGPRLLKAGQILPWRPEEEGFADAKVTNTRTALGRSAIGFSADRTRLYYVMFKQNVSLQRAAELMKQMGCVDAMNLEGGGTRSFAYNGRVLERGGRPQTHALVVYDANRPAPNALKQAWRAF